MSERVLVVSGGTKGIGRAIVDTFLKEGFSVFTCSRSQSDLDEMKTSDNSGRLHVFKADLSKKAEVSAFVEFVKSETPTIDVLVNNTGIFIPGKISEEEDGRLEQMMDTNLYSAYHLTRGFVQGMIENKSGDIFNICSIASINAYPDGGSYSISKFAMHGMSKGLREELKPHGIRVTAVLPGATYTASWDGVDLPEERFIKAQDVADAVWSTYQMSRNSVVEDLIIRPQLGDI